MPWWAETPPAWISGTAVAAGNYIVRCEISYCRVFNGNAGGEVKTLANTLVARWLHYGLIHHLCSGRQTTSLITTARTQWPLSPVHYVQPTRGSGTNDLYYNVPLCTHRRCWNVIAMRSDLHTWLITAEILLLCVINTKCLLWTWSESYHRLSSCRFYSSFYRTSLASTALQSTLIEHLLRFCIQSFFINLIRFHPVVWVTWIQTVQPSIWLVFYIIHDKISVYYISHDKLQTLHLSTYSHL